MAHRTRHVWQRQGDDLTWLEKDTAAAAPLWSYDTPTECSQASLTRDCAAAGNNSNDSSYFTQPVQLSQTDEDWDDEFRDALAKCTNGDAAADAEKINLFCSVVPFTTWCNRASDWLDMIIAASRTAADADADPSSARPLVSCISVLRGRGADWPADMTDEERAAWSSRVLAYQQHQLLQNNVARDDDDDDDTNAAVSGGGAAHRKRTRLEGQKHVI